TKRARAVPMPQTRGPSMTMRALIPAIAVVVVLVATSLHAEGTGGAAASDGLKPGDVLDQKSASRAEGLLPAEVLKHYQQNEYVNPIASWPEDIYNWPEDFQAGTKQN